MQSIQSDDARPPFLLGSYANGSLQDLPAECPFRCWDFPCDVVRHSLRHRKHGPDHPLVVVRCHTHGCSFTVYPAGFVPYARRALTPPAPASLQEVADEAAAGTAWARSAPGGTDQWWSTQVRLLRGLRATLIGLDGSQRHAVAIAVELPLHQVEALHHARGYRAIGLAVKDILADLTFDKLLLAGFLTGRWGAPYRWRAAPPRLIPLVPEHLRHAAKGSTNSELRPPPVNDA